MSELLVGIIPLLVQTVEKLPRPGQSTGDGGTPKAHKLCPFSSLPLSLSLSLSFCLTQLSALCEVRVGEMQSLLFLLSLSLSLSLFFNLSLSLSLSLYSPLCLFP